MYIDSATEEHVTGLAEELQRLRLENAIKNPEDAEPQMRRAALIRAEIESLGFWVICETKFDPSTLTVIDVVVTLLAPKEWLSGELLEIYEQWHAEAKARFERMKSPSP